LSIDYRAEIERVTGGRGFLFTGCRVHFLPGEIEGFWKGWANFYREE